MTDTNVIAKELGVTGFSPLANFLRLHVTKAMDDRVGNDPKLWNASNIEKVDLGPERHGFDAGTDEIVYDKVNPRPDYYQNGIEDDIAKEKANKDHQDTFTDGPQVDNDHAVALKDEAADDKLKAHAALLKIMQNNATFTYGVDA